MQRIYMQHLYDIRYWNAAAGNGAPGSISHCEN